MKLFLGFGLIAAGFCAAIYVAVWQMLILGIVQIIDGAKATPVDAMDIGLGIARVVLASPVGWTIAVIPLAIGLSWIGDSDA